jgi:hypothetical protein
VFDFVIMAGKHLAKFEQILIAKFTAIKNKAVNPNDGGLRSGNQR